MVLHECDFHADFDAELFSLLVSMYDSNLSNWNITIPGHVTPICGLNACWLHRKTVRTQPGVHEKYHSAGVARHFQLYTATQPVHAIGLEHTQISPEWLPIG